MFDMNELLGKKNQKLAMDHILSKKNGKGPDGMLLSEFEEYWRLNRDTIENAIRNGEFKTGIVNSIEILNHRGKKRIISSLNILDRFICRLLSQKMKQYFEPNFSKNSFAYQIGKGIVDAVEQAKCYINEGDQYVVKLDILNYFDEIPLEPLFDLVKEYIHDVDVQKLIYDYLHSFVMEENQIQKKKIGLVQGNPMSPILSNLYLDALDKYMDLKEYHWIRFADDISIYTRTREEGCVIWAEIIEQIEKLSLNINNKKSGIFEAVNTVLLGYDFVSVNDIVEVRKHKYQKIRKYPTWHPSALQKVNQEYHLIEDGILNKQDYALLFENEEEKHHIPVEVVQQLNVYGNITLSSNVLKTITEKNIRLAFFNKYGEVMGYYIPYGFSKTAKTVIKQCILYEDMEKHLAFAKKFETSCLHNIRANIRYYSKRKYINQPIEEQFTEIIAGLKHAKNMNELLLMEARARELYYQSFNQIIQNPDFKFEKRSRRPPKDPINAMISLGNTLLYNRCMRAISRTSLDVRIGILHAANDRSQTLNLDFADLFKPIIVDRIIFSLINRHWIHKDEHFVINNDGSVFLNKDGKRIFIEAFENKLSTKIVVKNKEYRYWQLIENEIRLYQKYIVDSVVYKPYKYY